MSRHEHAPETPATQFLKSQRFAFTSHLYEMKNMAVPRLRPGI